ncbi:hypothetical protein Q4Q35_15175 [Flavivirga aquimarina]|uniref:Aminotransferase class I/classII domain-containing protein n=1 Tax=Flavivirga aquimarina TaxID=2027862 RepID=A0ABT8WDB6_9FLAO|nr:hypothetical protein [Flavivirga aquimarina]MDO5971149.1 hypothetical protein [Flavivirga aquimarina]
MHDKLTKKKGYGSFFSNVNYESEVFSNSKNSFKPVNRKLFYSGRHAIKYIIETIKLNTKINTFWIPEYYCQHVTSWLRKNYKNIETYRVNPLDKSHIIKPDNFVSENDVVLINNFWGISHCFLETSKKNVFIIEDHSHGWLSKSCVDSNADFCFASLRKSVPVPLAGIAWIPNGEKLPEIDLKPSAFFSEIWNNIILGMKKKQEFEESISINENLKNDFLQLVYNAENMMHSNYDLVKIDRKHEKLIELYLNNDYLSFKERNFEIMVDLLKDNSVFELVDRKSTPFGLTLHFKSFDKLNHFKNYLISKDIYPSLLWPENKSGYGYFINIHIDYRYTDEDIKFITGIINNYTDR